MAGIDFRELEQFRDTIKQIGEQDAKELCKECSQQLAGRLLAKVVKRTPVGVKPEKPENFTVKLKGKHGRKRTLLTAEGANWAAHWQGYVGGTLRRGWTAGKKVSNFSDYAKTMPINVMSNNYRIEIINQVEYALYVEYGHRQTPGRYVPALGKRLTSSWVQGQFMMTKSVAEVDSIAQKVVDKKVKKFLEEKLNGK